MLKDFLTSKITRNNLGKFVSNNSSNGLTLDLGCGNVYYKKYFPNRIGFDIKSGPGIDVVGDAHHLPFENEKFDVILCTEVLEHLHSPEIAISEMERVLKKGGKLILTTRFIYPLHDIPHDGGSGSHSVSGLLRPTGQGYADCGCQGTSGAGDGHQCR